MGDDGELVAAEAGHQILAAHDVAQPLGDVEDELVADVMAERVVDVLEVIEVDVEHRRGRAAGAHVVDHGFEPLAEIDAVGQAADRIVQGEMAQLRFAGPDLLGGAPHVAQYETDQQREAAERDRDERQHAADDGAARPRRLPGNTRDRVALRIGKVDDVLVGGQRLSIEPAQLGQLQAVADLVQQLVIQIPDRRRDRRALIAGTQIAVGADGDRRDNRRPIHETLYQHRAATGLGGVGGDGRKDPGRERAQPPAQQIEARGKLRPQVERSGRGGVGRRAKQRVFDLVAAVEYHDDVLMVEGLQPFADAPIRPHQIVIVAKMGRGLRRAGGAVELAQHMRGFVGNGRLQQLLLAVERDLVGAFCRGQHGDDDADDGDGDNAADRHDETEPRLVPARPLASPGDLRLRRRQHASTLGYKTALGH